MSQAAVVYWSGTGHTEAMAQAVAAAAQADLFTAAEFDADKAAHYAAIAFGCPSMGAEQLEESEFEPMFEAVKPALAGKKIALFGSYGWGGGEWMRTWEDDCAAAGLTLCAESVICQDEPDDAALAACAVLGACLGAGRAFFPVRGRGALLPDVLLMGGLLLGTQSYAASLSAGGVPRWYMLAAAIAGIALAEHLLGVPLRAVGRVLRRPLDGLAKYAAAHAHARAAGKGDAQRLERERK